MKNKVFVHPPYIGFLRGKECMGEAFIDQYTLAEFFFTTVITIHAHPAREGTVLSNAERTVFIINTFRASVLPVVTQQMVGTLRVILR